VAPYNPSAKNDHKILWFILAVVFAASLLTLVAMIYQTMNWVRTKGTIPIPEWIHTLSTISQWGLTLSSIGILVLVTLNILKAYRTK
jgi:hypothetical protein